MVLTFHFLYWSDILRSKTSCTAGRALPALESTLQVTQPFWLLWALGVGSNTAAPTVPPGWAGAALLTQESPWEADRAQDVMESSQLRGANGQQSVVQGCPRERSPAPEALGREG